MILDTTTRKLQLQLTTAVTTAAMPITIDYVDNTTTTFTPGTSLSVSNGVTLVDILAAPAASTQRKVNSLTIYNLDTAAKTVRIYLNDNGTSYQILDITLQIDDVLSYTDVGGWYVVDLTGSRKIVQSNINLTSGVSGILPIANGGTNASTAVGALAALGAAASGPLASSGITGAAESGANSTILSLSGLTSPIPSANTVSKVQSVTCTQASGALTFGLAASALDFRNTTLTTGVAATVVNSALSLVLPSGGTLGFPTTISGRIILVAMNNAGTVELAIVSLAGGNDLTETGVISTTAIGAGSTANNVFYSTTARTGVAYRVVGSVDAVNTAGAWASPTLVQGYGGQALSAMSSFGYGQTWQVVTGSRVLGTTYYNTTGKPILVVVATYSASTPNQTTLTISGAGLTATGAGTGLNSSITAIVPPSASYSISGSGTSPVLSQVAELR